MYEDRTHNRTREMIEASVHEEADTGCWIWERQISNSGYGKIKVPGSSGLVMKSAATASYAAFIGPVPTDSLVVQTCGRRLCVNPKHLAIKPLAAIRKQA